MYWLTSAPVLLSRRARIRSAMLITPTSLPSTTTGAPDTLVSRNSASTSSMVMSGDTVFGSPVITSLILSS